MYHKSIREIENIKLIHCDMSAKKKKMAKRLRERMRKQTFYVYYLHCAKQKKWHGNCKTCITYSCHTRIQERRDGQMGGLHSGHIWHVRPFWIIINLLLE